MSFRPLALIAIALISAGCAPRSHWYVEKTIGELAADGTMPHIQDYLVVAGPFDTESGCLAGRTSAISDANRAVPDSGKVEADRAISFLYVCKLDTDDYGASHR